MPRGAASPPDRRDAATDPGYWWLSRRPLHVLAFLFPLIVGYEICLALLLRDDDGLRVNTVEAHRGLLRFFAMAGLQPAGGLYLGGLAIVVVLLVWHVLVRDRWRLDLPTLGFMAVEALLMTVPLLVLSHLVAAAPSVAAAAPPAFGDLDVWSQMAISVGAGLYEELLFRMVLIAVLHTLLVDLAKMPNLWGTIIAIGVSAVAFTFYHDLRGDDGTLSTRRVLFYLLAGVYLGVLFTVRGFGIVVGSHAIYDILTVLLTQGDEA